MERLNLRSMGVQAWAHDRRDFPKIRPWMAIPPLVWLERASKFAEPWNNYSLKTNISHSSINGVPVGDQLRRGHLIYKRHHFISLVVFSVPVNHTRWQTSVTSRKLYLKEWRGNKHVLRCFPWIVYCVFNCLMTVRCVRMGCLLKITKTKIKNITNSYLK